MWTNVMIARNTSVVRLLELTWTRELLHFAVFILCTVIRLAFLIFLCAEESHNFVIDPISIPRYKGYYSLSKYIVVIRM